MFFPRFLVLVKCNYLFLPPACSSQLDAELCCPCVLAAGRSGQPSGPTSLSEYHSPAAQRLPQLLGWQPRHSSQLVKNTSCISRDCGIKLLETLKSYAFLESALQFISASTKTQGLPFSPLFSVPFSLKQYSLAISE